MNTIAKQIVRIKYPMHGRRYVLIEYRPKCFKGVWKWKRFSIVSWMTPDKYRTSGLKHLQCKSSPHMKALSSDEIVMIDAAQDGEHSIVESFKGMRIVQEIPFPKKTSNYRRMLEAITGKSFPLIEQ